MPRFNFWTVVMILTWVLLFVLLFIPVGSVLVPRDAPMAFGADNARIGG